MSIETIEIFNNSDEWANQLKHLLSKGENLALLHGLTPDILDRIYAYAFDYHEKGNVTDAEIYYKFLCIYAFENHEYLEDFASVCQSKKKYQQAYDLYKLSYNYFPYDDYSVIYRMGQCQIGAKNIDNAMQCFYHIINNCEDDSVKSKAQAYIELLNDNSEDNG
ncbi:type III secretion-associated chaperone [Escherichia coli]|uniref:tetratricopeptide repeat protein n=1 Tax=Escherichia coli TaxID=562 RepID=UPI0006A22C21|nr:tetratricopeptide repeat protein [Escherichia coli]CTS33286.1 type III secretion-associated chaperone [Escherichia coli]